VCEVLSGSVRVRAVEGWKAAAPVFLKNRSRGGRCFPPIAVALLAAAAGLPPRLAYAQSSTQVVVPNSLPVQVVPKYPETGVNFSFPQGGLVDTGAVAGAVDVSSGSGSGGSVGTYSGTGSGVADATVAIDYSSLLGQSVGSGQCVALVQATSDVGLTSTWVPAEQVQGDTNLAPGTVIATFGAEGTYTNTPGQSHAAIYLGQDTTGIFVEDQWAGQDASTRHINWTTSNSYESGSQFYVVSH